MIEIYKLLLKLKNLGDTIADTIFQWVKVIFYLLCMFVLCAGFKVIYIFVWYLEVGCVK